MITRLRIQGFRGIADETIEFGPLTVLVGRNGAGKSAVIDALRFIRDALFDGLENAVSNRRGFGAIRHHPYDGPPAPSVGFEVVFRNAKLTGNYKFSLNASGDTEFWLSNEEFTTESTSSSLNERFSNPNPKNSFGITSYHPNLLVLALLTSSRSGEAYAIAADQLRGFYYHLFGGDMRQPQAVFNERVLMDDGTNLTTILREMQRGKDDGVGKDSILRSLGRIVPDVRDFRVQELAGFLVAQLLHGPATDTAKGNGNGGSAAGMWLGLHQESDGTLRALATLAALYQDVPPSYGGPLSLEEPENALHPGALAVLADAIRETATRRQIILTTQSPDLIARFRADELRVVERVDGATRVGPLAEHQRQAIERELFGAGDLLRIEGLQREPVTPPADAVPSPTPTGDAAA